MANTTYEQIFNRFLRECKDLQIALDLTDVDISKQALAEQKMIGYLESACDTFLVCPKDLTQKDNTTQTFLIEISGIEQEILSKKMVYKWVSSQLYTFDLLKMYVSDVGKLPSQANFIDKLNVLKKDLGYEIERLENNYAFHNKELMNNLSNANQV